MAYDDISSPPRERESLLPSSTASQAAGAISDDKPKQGVSRLRGAWIIVTLGVLIFLQACNISMLTTTQGIVAEELDAFAETSWFTSAFLIGMASMSPVLGRLSQIFNPRNCVFVSANVFAVGSLISSQADTLPVFLLGRAVTGTGAAGVLTLSIILVIELTSNKRRGLFIGLINSGFTLGVSFGAVIAGALVELTGWRALFWMQSPLALGAAISIFFAIPFGFKTTNAFEKQTLRQKLARIDYAGTVLLLSSLVVLLTSLAAQHVSILYILISIGLIVLFVLNEVYLASTPIIPVSVLRSRGALFSCLAQLFLMMARWSILFYTPVYALAVRGWSPASAGSILIPTNAGFAIGGMTVGIVHIRRGGSFYIPTLIAFALWPLTIFSLAFLSTPDTNATLYFFAMFCNGVITGSLLNYTLAHLLHLTSPSTHFIATSLLATFRGFAGSFGSAIGGGIYGRVLRRSLENGFAMHGLDDDKELIRRLLGNPRLVQRLTGVRHEIAMESYVYAIKVLFLAGTGLAIFNIFVHAATGWKNGEETKGEEQDDGAEESNEPREHRADTP